MLLAMLNVIVRMDRSVDGMVVSSASASVIVNQHVGEVGQGVVDGMGAGIGQSMPRSPLSSSSISRLKEE